MSPPELHLLQPPPGLCSFFLVGAQPDEAELPQTAAEGHVDEDGKSSAECRDQEIMIEEEAKRKIVIRCPSCSTLHGWMERTIAEDMDIARPEQRRGFDAAASYLCRDPGMVPRNNDTVNGTDAKRNYRLLYMFVFLTTLLCLYVSGFCWVYIIKIKDAEDSSI
ncbi:hypothetical protein TRIUR3_09632 [Triticum urartu]|uniref:Uncharacterized protein n=1 Tax=Triticum urartu TaxID=4572 RepID=M7ZV85_TRIUA|nr:hypothetical protein TRIUR3_09632 [Triticum urartu]